MAELSRFLREHTEEILTEWETFARSLPIGASMDVVALRDHAKAMLDVIARDLEETQTPRQQDAKAKGASDADERTDRTAATEHGSGRAQSGFTVNQMVAEFRALRASVLRLWASSRDPKARRSSTRWSDSMRPSTRRSPNRSRATLRTSTTRRSGS